ncbi:MAG: hypothetical protein IE932_07250 [Sphingopyxis terrae]|nr:hypothetical protein [Sphingopyxis terrae]
MCDYDGNKSKPWTLVVFLASDVLFSSGIMDWTTFFSIGSGDCFQGFLAWATDSSRRLLRISKLPVADAHEASSETRKNAAKVSFRTSAIGRFRSFRPYRQRTAEMGWKADVEMPRPN